MRLFEAHSLMCGWSGGGVGLGRGGVRGQRKRAGVSECGASCHSLGWRQELEAILTHVVAEHAHQFGSFLPLYTDLFSNTYIGFSATRV